jgi:Replicative DNA helicase
MTMTDAMLETIEARGIDVELAARLGLDSVRRDGGEALVIPFKRDGQVVRRKYRFFDRDEGKWTADKGGERIAFNEDCLRDDSLIGQPLIITEGEFDAIAAIQAGFGRTISVPDGAPPPGERSAEDLEASAKYSWLRSIRPLLTPERVETIIIAADGDDNGAALLQDLSVQLMRARCKYLTYPRLPKPMQDRLGRERCKDLNEVLQFYGSKGVVETINRAQWLQVDGVYLMSELPPVSTPPIWDIGFNLLSDHYKARPGDFVVITGVPGLGKSTFANDVCCRLALNHGLRIAWASFEQAPQRDHRRALRSWYGRPYNILLDVDPRGDAPRRQGTPAHQLSAAELAEADAWIDRHHVFIVPSEDDDVTLDWMLDRMEAAVVRFGVQVIVIDPWNEMDHTRARDETMTEYVGRAIKALKRFARKFEVHLILVAHPTKSLKDGDGKYKMPTLYDISDSANWYNKCDLGLIVHRETEDDTIIKVQKSRYHDVIGRPGEVCVHYSRDERRFIEQERRA